MKNSQKIRALIKAGADPGDAVKEVIEGKGTLKDAVKKVKKKKGGKK